MFLKSALLFTIYRNCVPFTVFVSLAKYPVLQGYITNPYLRRGNLS